MLRPFVSLHVLTPGQTLEQYAKLYSFLSLWERQKVKLILYGEIQSDTIPKALGMCRSTQICAGPARLSELLACLCECKTSDISVTRGPMSSIDFNKGRKFKSPWSWDELLQELLTTTTPALRRPKELVLHPTREDVMALSIDVPGRPVGYNIGDLLNCPAFHLKGWTTCDARTNEQIARSLPRSIFSIYHDLSSCIPAEVDGNLFRQAVTSYRHSVADPVILDALQLASRGETLVVHIRLGDKGISVNQLVRRQLQKLGPAFGEILICTGMYVGHHTDQNVIDRMYEESKNCMQDILATHAHAVFLTEGSPDDHLAVMSTARHLMLSTGGFTQLAALVSEGKIYKTDALQVTPKSWIAQLSPLAHLVDMTGDGIIIEHGCGTCRRKLLPDRVELLNGYHHGFGSHPARSSTDSVLVTREASYVRSGDRWVEVKHENLELVEWNRE